MRKSVLLGLVFFAACGAGSCAFLRRGAAPRHLTILYASDLYGQLEPCGCSAHQRGGLPRAATVVARIRAENPNTVFVAGGDLLFSAEDEGDPARADQAKAKAKAVAEILKGMGLAATIEADRDDAMGAGFARSTGLPFTRGERLGDLGFGALGSVPDAPVKVGVVHAGGTRGALAQAAAAKAQGLALVFGAHREQELEDDVNRAVLDGPLPAVQVQGRGQSLARVDVTLAGDLSKGFLVLPGAAQRDEELDLIRERVAEYDKRVKNAGATGNTALATALQAKIAELEARAKSLKETPLPRPPADRPSLTVSFIPITDDIPEDAKAKALVVQYEKDAASLNLAYAAAHAKPCPAPAKGEAYFTGLDDVPPGGTDSCATCHKRQVAFWRTTEHAKAYETLEEKHRQFDLDCVKCHVTGWMRPGGVCSVAKPGGRTEVQCEMCHGAASAHAIDPPEHIVRDPGEQTCKACHTPENSTGFEFTSYRKKIIGPGHGLPLGK